MNKTDVFSAVRNAIINQPNLTYRRIAEVHGISIATVQKVAGILRKETGFQRPLGRPLGTGKGNARTKTYEL